MILSDVSDITLAHDSPTADQHIIDKIASHVHHRILNNLKLEEDVNSCQELQEM